MSRKNNLIHEALSVFKEDLRAIGESKHELKENFKADYSGNKSVADFMHNFAKTSGIVSYRTYESYKTVVKDFMSFVSENHSEVKHIDKLERLHAEAYLNSLASREVAKSTYSVSQAALNKFSSGLEKHYGNKYDFNLLSDRQVGNRASLEVREKAGYHPYKSGEVEKIVEAYKQAHDKGLINDKQLLTRELIASTGQRGLKLNVKMIGVEITNISKGGKPLAIGGLMSNDLKGRVEDYLKDNKRLTVSRSEYDKDLKFLKSVCKAENITFQGNHGFRHSAFLNYTEKLIAGGMSEKEAQLKASLDIGNHNRLVGAYLRE